MDARLRFTLVLSALHTLTFLAVWAGMAVLFRRGLGRDFQVAGGKAPAPELGRSALREVLLGHALFPVLCHAAVYPAWIAAGGRVNAPWPAWYAAMGQLLAFILIEDTIFYWAHRALHTRALFRRVHAKHHRFRYVRAPAAEYAHPLENAINFVALFAGPIAFASAPPLIAVWMVLRMCETLEAHSGYAFTSSSSRHAFHHLYAQRGCYGSFMSPWDRLMGTDRAWRAWRAQQP